MPNRRFSSTASLGVGGLLLFVAIALFTLWFIPWAGIWALNGLFGTAIEQSLANWGYFWLVKLTLTGTAAVNRK